MQVAVSDPPLDDLVCHTAPVGDILNCAKLIHAENLCEKKAGPPWAALPIDTDEPCVTLKVMIFFDVVLCAVTR